MERAWRRAVGAPIWKGMRAFVLSLALMVGTSAGAAVVAGHPAPDYVVESGRMLKLTGTSVQKKLWIRILGAALYLETPTTDPNTAVDPSTAKQLRLYVLHDIDHERFGNALFEGFKRTLSHAELARLKPELLRFIDTLWALRDGQVLHVTWIPGEGLTVTEGGRTRARFRSDAFAQALFGIWIGPSAPMPKVRDSLLSR